MSIEYIIYADESSSSGTFFSNFYGGALVRSTDLLEVEGRLEDEKDRLLLAGEIKWSKVTDQYLDRYLSLLDVFFDLIAEGKVKIRIMFTQNLHRADGLTEDQRANRYHLLYYQFVKHAFGLRFSNDGRRLVRLRILLDKLPGTREQRAILKGYIAALRDSKAFREAAIWIDVDQIAEVESHNHVIMQCLDVVLGSMQFRLNNLHLAKPQGERTRGKKTRAKEKLYKRINARIRALYPGFNVGISTGRKEGNSLWRDAYRHWRFVPRHHTRDSSRTKE